MPSLDGQVWVVTGANSGVGLATTTALASKGAHVVMACRTPSKAEGAASGVRVKVPGAKLELRTLDLASLASVQRFAAELTERHPVLHGLINNAGLMAPPRAKTADGFELQMGTNHLGHFALTLRLLPALERSPAPRVVTVSSSAHTSAKLDVDDLMMERSYSAVRGYSNSKLANLLFTAGLARRLAAARMKTLTAASHPGYADTGLPGATARSWGSRVAEWATQLGGVLLAQSAEMGALPSLYAATSSAVRAGDYIGPDGLGTMRGWPTTLKRSAAASDAQLAERLWALSEQLTGVTFPQLPA